MNQQAKATCLPWLGTDALPAWQQTQIVLPDGVSPADRYNDCGETCVAMLVAAVWGVPVSPDSLRAELHGTGGSGLTTAEDLVAAAAYCNVQCTALTLAGVSAKQRLIVNLTDARPGIMLGRWPTPGGVLHWLLATSTTDQGISYINPWGGVHSSLAWSDWHVYFAGQIVLSNAHLHVDAHTWPLPW